MMRGEETIEKERERNGQRARSGKIAGYIARMQRGRRGLSMEENAGDCDDGCGHIPSLPFSPVCHLPILLPFSLLSIYDTYSLTHMRTRFSSPFHYRSFSHVVLHNHWLTLTSMSFNSMNK